MRLHPDLREEDEREPRFGNYELIELLARGGMGVVYKARQTSLNRIVALKMIQGGALAGEAEIKRFQAEAEAIAHLQHPNIVAIHEVGYQQGQHFFSMDYVAGRTLADIVHEGPMPARRAAAYVKTTAEAVNYAHQHGIIHRDLKPANIIIDQQNQPRITDFGLAKRVSDSHATLPSQITLSGQVLGSPNYLPPEQADPKRGTPGAESDVYALGAILYHLVTGRPPFQAESLTTLLRQVIETDPVPPRSLNPSIPRDLETVCLKCLAKEPRLRYATAQALADDLARFLKQEPVLARPVGPAGKAWRWCCRQPVRAGLISALLLTLLLGSLGVLLAWREAELRRRAAVASELRAQENAYAADMNLAQVELQKGDLGAAMALLNAHRPKTGQRDLRGWEWRYLWKLCRSDELFELTASPATVLQVAFASDSRHAVLRNDQATLGVWDLRSRQRVFAFNMRGEPFACSQVNNLLAYSVRDDRAVSIVSLGTGQEIARIPLATNLVALSFSIDAARLFTLTQDGALTGWSVASRQAFYTAQFPWPDFEPIISSPRRPCLSPRGSVAFRVDSDTIGLWEADSGRQVQLRLPATAGYPTALSFSPDEKWLAAGAGESDSEILVWAVEDLWQASGVAPPPRARFGRHPDWICDLAFSPDSQALVSAGADSALRVWHMDHPEACRTYQGHRHQVSSVAWSPDNKRIVSGGVDGTVRAWDPGREPTPHGPRVLPVTTRFWSLQLSADGNQALAVDAASGSVLVWDTLNLRLAQTLAFAGTNNTVAEWTVDGKTLATGDALGNVRIWDIASERPVAHMLVAGYVIGHFHFSPDGRFLACGALGPKGPLNRLPKVWSVDGWREIPLPPDALRDFVFGDFSPKSGQFVALHWGGALDIWDTQTGRCVARFSQPLAGPHELGMAWFLPDGRRWASFTQRGVLCLWDGTNSGPPVVIARSGQELWNIGFAADGSRLLLSGTRASDSVRLLDLANHRFVLTLPGKADLYFRVRMSRDNSTVSALSSQGVLLWRAPSWAEIEAGEKRAPKVYSKE